MRSLRIDTLRGIAVFGILTVNIWSFVHAGSTPRYGVFDAGAGTADHAIVYLVAAFAEQKFYPIFAFLFGAGFALQTGGSLASGARRAPVAARYRRRIRWLLACGLLHGTLIWYGDILTMYAVAAFWLAWHIGRRPRALLASMREVVIVNVLVQLAMAWLVFNVSQPGAADIALMVIDGQATLHTFTTGSWMTIARARWSEFGGDLLYGLLFLPRIALFFLAGAFAVRLGWLTRPGRHPLLWRRVLAVAAGIGLPLNLWWGYVALRESLDPFAPAPWAGLALYLIDLAGPCLAAGYVALVMLARGAILAGIARVFAPVGRIALTNYLAQSVVCSVLLQGFGLGLGAVLTHGQLFALALAIMLAQAIFSRYWVARYAQGPVEALWRRYAGPAPATAAADRPV